ncbi:hypothetical protein ACQP2U_43350 (plasmid) [Nocardia sp. CA-084685]|uniref:hypothetical protein n=1 Tax=Nocardia sp. CA-084685 TaxID=3239970 RepID=UPI003D95D8A4
MPDPTVLDPSSPEASTGLECETDCGNCNVCWFLDRIADLEATVHALKQTLLGGVPAVATSFGYQFTKQGQRTLTTEETEDLDQARNAVAHLLRTQKLRDLTPDAVVVSRCLSAWTPRTDLSPTLG